MSAKDTDMTKAEELLADIDYAILCAQGDRANSAIEWLSAMKRKYANLAAQADAQGPRLIQTSFDGVCCLQTNNCGWPECDCPRKANCHSPEAVTYAFNKARELLVEAGFSETAALLLECRPRAQADAQGRCARCGSSGDTYVLCSGCGAPTSSDAQGGEVVAWQDIETAPHETNVLLGWWGDGEWNCQTGMATHEWRRGPYSTMSQHGQATHWQPLPSPPLSGEPQRAESGPAVAPAGEVCVAFGSGEVERGTK